jgi:hypothetical protein
MFSHQVLAFPINFDTSGVGLAISVGFIIAPGKS